MHFLTNIFAQLLKIGGGCRVPDYLLILTKNIFEESFFTIPFVKNGISW